MFEQVYVSDFGVIRMTSNLPPHRQTKAGRPDMRTSAGKLVARYFKHIDQVARSHYIAGDDLAEAPLFSEWLNDHN